MLLELQAAMSQREADCRAKDEQLGSLRQLLDGLQLELQRCSDAEKDLRVCRRRRCSLCLPLPVRACRQPPVCVPRLPCRSPGLLS